MWLKCSKPKRKEHYEDTWVEPLHLTCVEREEIARDFTTFWLEPAKENHSLPNYQPGQHLPIEMVINGEKVLVVTPYRLVHPAQVA